MSNYNVSKIFVWANSDLDGACSTILLGNIFPDMEYKSAFFGDFANQYAEWEHNLENYDKVFIIGMVLDQSLINKIDDYKVVFVSDRGEKLNVFDSTMISEETSSCCKLLYKKFKDKFDIPNDLKKLILYVDDYNVYSLKHKESEYLNGLYRNTRFNRFKVLVNRFWNGYDGLTDKEMALAESFFDAIDTEYKNLELYEGTFKEWSVVAVFSKFSVNEIAKKLIDNHKKDVIIVVNPDTQFVSFRKPEGSIANITFMAENLCNGGGGEWASGGKISQKFLDFTQKLIQI
jgi:oligoribonuclease NrnB/cAMP/cGMP phosphodiesterase (DHH superfamily)